MTEQGRVRRLIVNALDDDRSGTMVSLFELARILCEKKSEVARREALAMATALERFAEQCGDMDEGYTQY